MRMLVEEDQQEINQLKELKEIVDEWRDNKKHSAEKMPDSIWDRVFLLIEKTTIPENEVLRSLGIKSEQIKNRRKSLVLGKNLTTKQLSNVQNDRTYKGTQTTQVEMCKPDGTVIKFQAPLSELLSILN